MRGALHIGRPLAAIPSVLTADGVDHFQTTRREPRHFGATGVPDPEVSRPFRTAAAVGPPIWSIVHGSLRTGHHRERLGVFVDTSHLRALGFDLSGAEAGEGLPGRPQARAPRAPGRVPPERLQGRLGCRGEGGINTGLVSIDRHAALQDIPPSWNSLGTTRGAGSHTCRPRGPRLSRWGTPFCLSLDQGRGNNPWAVMHSAARSRPWGWWMRMLGGVTRAVVLVLALVAPAAAVDGPALTARAAIVMDAGTGRVLWEENSTTPLPPASTTKVMTAVLALESGRLSEDFRVSVAAAETPPSGIDLRAGQRMALRNLLFALMLRSANDSATVIAEGLAGSEARFAERMTARAHELGAETARFQNPHGLSAPGHVASSRDLAVIFRHALGLAQFRDILETRSIQVPVEGVGVRWVALRSHNRLLTDHRYPVIGKTGYTRAARRCFVGAASRGGQEIVIAVLGSSDLWGDAKRLLAFGFGEPAEAPPVVMAKATSGRRARRPAVAEGDDDVPRDPRIARYAVKLGPYSSRSAALASRAKLARRGYTAVLAGNALRLGQFANPKRAEEFATRLRRAGYLPTVVLL